MFGIATRVFSGMYLYSVQSRMPQSGLIASRSFTVGAAAVATIWFSPSMTSV